MSRRSRSFSRDVLEVIDLQPTERTAQAEMNRMNEESLIDGTPSENSTWTWMKKKEFVYFPFKIN